MSVSIGKNAQPYLDDQWHDQWHFHDRVLRDRDLHDRDLHDLDLHDRDLSDRDFHEMYHCVLEHKER